MYWVPILENTADGHNTVRMFATALRELIRPRSATELHDDAGSAALFLATRSVARKTQQISQPRHSTSHFK